MYQRFSFAKRIKNKKKLYTMKIENIIKNQIYHQHKKLLKSQKISESYLLLKKCNINLKKIVNNIRYV